MGSATCVQWLEIIQESNWLELYTCTASGTFMYVFELVSLVPKLLANSKVRDVFILPIHTLPTAMPH